MKIILIGVNARYSHTNLAIRLIKTALSLQCIEADILEFTINANPSEIATSIALQAPEILGFSCYIWNIEFVKRIIADIRLILPSTKIILGGPEASNHAQQLLTHNKVDIVILGEGENITPALLLCLTRDDALETIHGIAFINEDGDVVHTPLPAHFDLNCLPLAYTQEENTANRIIYYESSRGCPYRCSYCLSANDKTLRYRSVEAVISDLEILLRRKAMQVKFIDRTFNSDPARAMKIWQYIIAHDNGFTGFHFEIHAQSMNQEMIALLQSARPHLIQLEIGVQSIHPPTLAAIGRSLAPEKFVGILGALSKNHNLHLHLDLIAGLPFEGMKEFALSFDYLYELHPTMIQLGFLKVLTGSPMGEQAVGYSIVSSPCPPYQVLSTKWLSVKELFVLSQVEEAVETYYNSGRFAAMLDLLMRHFASAFVLFVKLGEIIKPDPIAQNHDSLWYYAKLFDFGVTLKIDPELLAAACRLDIYSSGRPKKMPPFAQATHARNEINAQIKCQSTESLTELNSRYYIDFMPEDIQKPKEAMRLVAFDYADRDIAGRARQITAF